MSDHVEIIEIDRKALAELLALVYTNQDKNLYIPLIAKTLGMSQESLRNLRQRKFGWIRPMVPRWTKAELEILEENYPTKTMQELLELLPRRNGGGIEQKVLQLGLLKEGRKPRGSR